jgi:hypothetical protein
VQRLSPAKFFEGIRGWIGQPSVQCRRYDELPFPKDWKEWRRRFAVAKLPRIDGVVHLFTAEELVRVLTRLGFQHDLEQTWRHADGSWLVLKSENVIDRVGFQRWGFSSLPYQINADLGQWVEDTIAWEAWVRGKRRRPPF